MSKTKAKAVNCTICNDGKMMPDGLFDDLTEAEWCDEVWCAAYSILSGTKQLHFTGARAAQCTAMLAAIVASCAQARFVEVAT